MRKRILFVNEANYLSTGYSVYGHEVLRRLHETGKYEVAELGVYGQDDDPRWRNTPWKFFPNQPCQPNEVAAYNARLSNHFGEWRFERACLEFKPHVVVDIRDWWMCLSPYTTIVCDDGLKDVQDIAVGDNVLTHTGIYRKVTKTFSRSYSGKMLRLQASNCAIPIFLTEKHPILTIKRKGNRSLPELSKKDLEWIDSDKIEKGDIVCFPVPKDIGFCVNETLADKCRLLGYYAAEGCILYEGRAEDGKLKGIQLTFGIDEQDYVSDVKNLIHKLYGTNAIVKIKTDTLVVRAYSAELAKDIQNLLPGKAGTKLIHKEIFSLPNKEIRQFLCGLFRGDGSYNQETKRCNYCTKSKTLAWQVFQLCIRLGMLPSFNLNKNKLKKQTFYRYIFSFASSNKANYKAIIENKGETILPCKRIKDGYAFITIKKTSVYEDNCTVYNFEVEKDNSYVSSFCLHNCEFEERSPFRPFYKLIWMPTVDSAPIHKQWMASYLSADAVLAYSEFGQENLSKQGGSLIKFKTLASPGANPEHFPYIADKRAHKKSLGMPEDIFVVGTVMRNQERKLYPDLIYAFADFLKQAPPEIAKKTYLYLHTAYPDVGWEIPELILEAGIANKCIVTYNCQACGVSYPSFYQDVRTFCRNCKQYMASLPNVKAGSSRAALGQIMNCFDVYVQYAICEGFGMPLVEAAACGSIIFGVDYSAISDIIKNLEGVPIKVQRMARDPKTYAWRAFPDNQDLVNKLIEVLQWEPEYRLSKGAAIKDAVLKRYNWDNTAKAWESCLDEIDVIPDEQSWKLPSRAGQPNRNPPEGLTNEQFVQWAIVNTARRPELLDSYIAMRIVRDLNWGIWQSTPAGIYFNDASHGGIQAVWTEYTREHVMQEMLRACEQQNYWEGERTNNERS